MGHHLRRLEREGISVDFPRDAGGYSGRQCPRRECHRYFKVAEGTGILVAGHPCTCPYCGHVGSGDAFLTRDQRRYLDAVATREVVKALVRDYPGMLEEGHRDPLPRYSERNLEEHVTCSKCTLKYAVYGVFAHCPDCGVHNSHQILAKNLALVEQQLALAEQQQGELAAKLVEDALENVVSSFDGFGREACRVRASASTDPGKVEKLSFQNLTGAQQQVLTLFSIDISAALSSSEWALAARGFQKRHIFAHSMGVVDQKYVDKTGDVQVRVGQKMPLAALEVRDLCASVEKIGAFLVSHLP